TIREVIYEISGKRLGAAVVTADDGEIKGIITDGDLRRMLEKHDRPADLTAADILTATPRTIEETELAVAALEIMRTNDITQLVVTRNGKYAGVLHLHDLVKEGLI